METDEILKIIDEWEEENTKVLKIEDIIKKKVVIADYIKWDKIRELKQRIKNNQNGKENKK